MIRILTLAIAIGITNSAVTASTYKEQQSELETVSFVDIERFLGKWYDIASIPQRFSRDCTNTAAE